MAISGKCLGSWAKLVDKGAFYQPAGTMAVNIRWVIDGMAGAAGGKPRTKTWFPVQNLLGIGGRGQPRGLNMVEKVLVIEMLSGKRVGNRLNAALVRHHPEAGCLARGAAGFAQSDKAGIDGNPRPCPPDTGMPLPRGGACLAAEAVCDNCN